MTSRKLLWMALGVFTAPLFVNGTGGCGFEHGQLSAPIDDNAYNCGCKCGRPETRNIVASPGDVEQAGPVMTLNGMDLDLGAETVGLRFPNAMIPAGAEILSARVQFRAATPTAPGVPPENAPTDLDISAELSTNAAVFTTADNDLSGRTFTAQASDVPWAVADWVAPGDALEAEQTPNLGPLVQELVSQPGWNDASAVVLRFAGTGQRSAVSFDASPAGAAVLTVSWVSLQASLPVCTTQEIFEQNDDAGVLPQALAEADCASRVTDTLSGLAAQCGYPSECRCGLDTTQAPSITFDRTPCNADCTATPLIVEPPAEKCSNFDPERFEQCVEDAGQNCAQYVSATNVEGNAPVCTAFEATPAMAARVFGNNSRCELAGTSQIEVGDREPTHDPMTTGVVEITGDPCPGGGCAIGASFALAMDPITFSVRFASDPMFYDLGALGESRSPTTLNGLDAVFAEDQVVGTGNGRRGSDGIAIDALNQQALTLGVDWTARLCDLNGNVASTVDGENPDGTCAGDGTTPCTADSPDCDGPGGPCEFEAQDIEDMIVDVSLAGSIVNQPPAAAAGADQLVECTSPSGATFTLQGVATDPDPNIALVSWRAGSRIGPEVGQDLALTQSLGVGVQQTYVLKVIDAFMQADEDAVQAGVVDTTGPQLTLSVAPFTMTPPNHKLVPITATLATSDVCDPIPVIRLVSITSSEPDNGLGDGDQPNDIQGAAFGTDDRSFQLRRERGGTAGGRIYTITYSSADASGNTTLRQATVAVPH